MSVERRGDPGSIPFSSTNPMDRQLFLVLGLNRSGTSALTKALAACGAAIGFQHPALATGLWKNDQWHPAGGYESHEVPPVLWLVREIVDRAGGTQANPLIGDEISLSVTDTFAVAGLLNSIPSFPFAIKDPLLTFQYRQWKQIAREAKIDTRAVVSLRDPLQSAHALLKRRFCRTIRGGLEQWLRYYSEVKFLLDAGEQPMIVFYDGDMDSYLPQIAALCGALGLTFDREKVRGGFTPAPRQEHDAGEMDQHPLGDAIRRLFDDLRSRKLE